MQAEDEQREGKPDGVRRIGLGPVGWGVAAIFCNLAFAPTLLALITGFATLRDLRRVPPTQRPQGAATQAWLGMLMGLFWPVAMIVIGVAAVWLTPADKWSELQEGVRKGFQQSLQGAPTADTPLSGSPAEAREVLVLPAGHDPATPLPMVIWLHGYGSDPDLVSESFFQRAATAHGVAIVGVSAPVQYEPEVDAGVEEPGYVWTEDAVLDGAHVIAALERIADRVTPEPGRVVLFGFSQGAAVAAELALRDPVRYAGAILLSPGGFGDPTSERGERAASAAGPASAAQQFIISVGAGETYNVESAARIRDDLEALELPVTYRAVEGQEDHAFPDDFYARFPEWLEHVLAKRGGLQRTSSERELVTAQARTAIEAWLREGQGDPQKLEQWALHEIRPSPLADLEALVAEQVAALRAERLIEQKSWPKLTDCDRLDRAFAALQAEGILARQDYEDCNTCAMAAIDAELVASKEAGSPARGYVLYHMQDTQAAARGEGLYLSYGSIEGSDAAGLSVGKEVVEQLRRAGLKTRWDGTFEQRIGVTPLDWKKRILPVE